MVLGRLRRWLGRRPDTPEADDPGALFRVRYHALRLLLAANNRALELMAEMERAAHGDHAFGMAFVRSHCTALSVSVFQMVRQLDSLAPSRYGELLDRLAHVQHQIQEALVGHRVTTSGQPLVVPLDRLDRRAVDVAGSKMANLGEARTALGLEVPPGFVITARAFQLLLDHGQLQAEIDRLIQSSEGQRQDELFALSSRLQQLVARAEVPAELARAVSLQLGELTAGRGAAPRLALRSSALGEDEVSTSFAGQYRSQLNVHPDHLLDTYREIAASKYTPQAMHYRLQRGLRDDEVAMCVGCLEMVDARAGGVAYTSNPSDPSDRRVFVSSVWGLPKGVVDGSSPSDLFVLERRRPPLLVERRVAHKTIRLVNGPDEGVVRAPVAAGEVDAPSLDDATAARVADIALRLEDHFGTPQDVEWALADDGRVVLLQCRPLRQVAAPVAAATPAAAAAQPWLAGGVTVSPGVAAGPVCRVRRDSDALRFPDGAVLVLEEPLPRWAALLGRTAAVLAAVGGLAGHLATVAREFGVPALFGLAGLEDLEDGVEVTVDADRGAVYRGVVTALVEAPPARPPLMIGTPVHDVLLATLEHIAPLNLLDPDAPEFRPRACRTLHDITRFCHEQAVREMFDFSHRQRFPRHAAKQLHHEVPMQWWVLDLDDGFAGEVEGRYVRLADIACRPMLALWEGMVAIPWEGPPAVSGRGLASVLFEATANPALATPFRSAYSQRNYFMISSNFMNLQSRFGFHFSAVETLVSERDPENYLSFSFKGGAADLARRRTRVLLLADILERYGFGVEVIEDCATARLGGLPAAVMEERLRVVGYLIMHTRQLDMVMADSVAVEHYRGKLLADLEKVV